MYIFILGLIFGLCIQPLLDSFTSLILTFFEMIKSGMNIKINTNNQKIQWSMEDQGTSHAIGFVYSEEGEEETYYEEDE